MEKDKEMLLAGDPEFELSQVEGEEKKAGESLSITYDFGNIYTIICCG